MPDSDHHHHDPSPPSPPQPSLAIAGEDEPDQLRLLSRSPHPYHRQSFELLHPSDKLAPQSSTATTITSSSPSATTLLHPSSALHSPFFKDSTQTSDSGTDADDEHFLKGLPAPRTRLHKGLRGRNEPLSGTSTPLLPPELLEEEGRKVAAGPKLDAPPRDRRANAERSRRKKELIRRGTELLILFSLGAILCSNRDVKPLIHAWRKELAVQCLVAVTLAAIYPIRVVYWTYSRGSPSQAIPLHIPASFEPGQLFYPPTIPIYVALLLAPMNHLVVLPNLVLSLSSLPRTLIPLASEDELCSPVHWLVSIVPVVVAGLKAQDWELGRLETVTIKETLILLYPLHQNLCMLLHQLTTTSLLPAELQLLSIALINTFLFSTSPQMVILKALLWGGGISLVLSCGHVIQWGITLARVPKWRFRRPSHGSGSKTLLGRLSNFVAIRRFKYEIFGTDHSDSDYALSEDDNHGRTSLNTFREGLSLDAGQENPISLVEALSLGPEDQDQDCQDKQAEPSSTQFIKPSARRHTLPSLTINKIVRSKTHTPSGRRKRSASSSIRAFFSLTYAQATARKWAYAAWMYLCILGIILVGIRAYVGEYALQGEEPIGWALGYLFGDLPWFRLQVLKANLEQWICLPSRHEQQCASELCMNRGWVEHLRHSTFGEANTRLLLSGYMLCIIIVGLAVVFRLTPIYEVDTRRKVFHFMMVGMLLPATYVDPAYVALALALILAIFLLLDLVRASQLPPLSKPIASFLAPYVDGRDLRGPVVISHIFLLIGCSIPLWLSLAALGREGGGRTEDAADDGERRTTTAGWEVPTRDVSMVSGVVCVGLGDAAASLIGRRWGHRKWVWGGGKSLEGSVAFAAAVFLGLAAASAWLRLGGWAVTGEGLVGMSPPGAGDWTSLVRYHLGGWTKSLRGAAACGTIASLTEAVLTGGNDNVIVPVVLWTCVKSLGV